MNVLITGATGFIGTALCDEMLERGHSVTAVIRPNSEKKSKLPRAVSLEELELDKISELTGTYDICYHLAWNGSSGSARNDFDIQMSNVKYTAEVIKTAKRLGCKRVIGAGSQAEYGVVHKICDENTTPNPFMMYGAAKLAAYYMGSLVARDEEISLVWPRIYSVYGVGENDGTLMSYLVKCLKEGKTAELSPCENMWDFMYITDCVKALALLGETDDSNGIYNVSAGKPRLLKEFVNEAREIINPNAEIKFGAKSSDPKRTFWLEPSVDKLKVLGFECEVGFNEGIKRKAEEME